MSFSMINRHKYPWSFILIYLENIDVVDFLVSSPLKIGKLRHCLHFIKSKTFSFWRFQSLAKIKNFRNKKYIKLLNGGVLIRAKGSDFFFKKKLSGGEDIYSGSKSNAMKDPLLIMRVILWRWSAKTLILSSLRR